MKPARSLSAATLLACSLMMLCQSHASPGDHQKLGTVEFAVTGRPEAQAEVVRGVKLVHHMMYVEADQAFAAALAADPDCALGYWGRAMTLIHPLWPDAPSEADRKKGADLIQRGLACTRATPRERAYLETLDLFFNAGAPGDYPTRLQALDRAWEKLSAQNPDDLDALAFSALYHLAPARFLPKDKSNRIQLAAASRLQEVSRKIPDHPGAQHYKIHAYDFPLLADRALEVCDTYSGIAPDVPHALHMPTHIYTRRGLWKESIEFNRRSADAGRKLDQAAGTVSSHLPHAYDYLAYAYLQRGQYRAADAIRQELTAQRGPYHPGALTQIGFAYAAVPARYALERQAWEEAARLEVRTPADFPWGKPFLNCDSIVHFARALGAARSGQRNIAQTEIAALEKVLHELSEGNRPPYWVAQARTQLLAARAWVEFAEKKTEPALALMRQAVELEMTVDKEAVTPGEVLPAGDLLGDMLLEADRPAEALAAYEAVLSASPNRLNTLYGAGIAAERGGNPVEARRYYEQLVQTAADADANVARVEHARAFLAKPASSYASAP